MWLFAANPSAHSGDAADRIDAAAAALTRAGLPVRLQLTRPGDLTVSDVSTALRTGSYKGVIAMGGDGTFHAVANGLLRSRTGLPMGLIAAGTGNNQARSLGLPLDDLDAAANVIAHGLELPMDGGHLRGEDPEGGRIPDRWFFDSLGFGFSARALQARFADKAAVDTIPVLRDIYQDGWVYVGAVTRALLASYVEDTRFDVRLRTEHDDAVFTDLVDLIVNNTRVYARAWVLDGRSRHDDGEMEVVPIAGRDEWLMRAVVDLDGNPMRAWWDEVVPPALPASARRIDLEVTPRPGEAAVAMQVDGEVAPPMRWARIRVRRGALRMRTPLPGLFG